MFAGIGYATGTGAVRGIGKWEVGHPRVPVIHSPSKDEDS
jgi:hypothetical protein